jgi:drug/metabolite transporter (DMT)-like permease
MPFYIYAWIGAIASGLIVVTAKLTSKHSISNPWLFNFLLVLVTLLFTIPPALIYKAGMPINWIPLILAAISSTLFNIFWIFSTYALDVSTLAPLFNIRGVFAVIIGSLFLNETFSQNQLIYIVIILVAGMFVSLDERFNIRSFFNHSIGIAVLTMLFLTLNSSFIKISLIKNSLWTNNLWIAIINTLFLIPTIPLFQKELKKLDLNHVLPIGAMGVFSTITEFSANVAFGVNVGITSLIMNTPFSMILAFFFSIFAPKLLEKHSFRIYAIRFTATAIMIFSAMQLTK